MNEMINKQTARRILTAAKDKALPSLLGIAGVVPRTLSHTLGVGIGAFAAGLAVGVGGALLLSPAKGEEMRAMAKDYLQAHIDAVRGATTSASQSAEDAVDEADDGDLSDSNKSGRSSARSKRSGGAAQA